jgi:hypothetical protein
MIRGIPTFKGFAAAAMPPLIPARTPQPCSSLAPIRRGHYEGGLSTNKSKVTQLRKFAFGTASVHGEGCTSCRGFQI